MLLLFVGITIIQFFLSLDAGGGAVSTFSFQPQVRMLKIDVYGGSITRGWSISGGTYGCAEDMFLRYSSVLQREMPEFEIGCSAVPASGVERMLLSGIEPADVIVSEFQINEKNGEQLRKWYQLAQQSSQHVVILDLWSWLDPPARSETNTVKSLRDLRESLASSNETFNDDAFSVLSLDKLALESEWQEQMVPLFFNFTGDDKPIPQECYDNALESNPTQQAILIECRGQNANNMQHGRAPYHAWIAENLLKHLRERVVHRLSRDLPLQRIKATHSSKRIGSWGISEDADNNWDTVISSNHEFKFGYEISGRPDKISLHSNSLSASVVLDCPPSFKNITVGFVSHSELGESGVMTLNGVDVTTSLTGSWRSKKGIRIKTYSDSLIAPVNVGIKSLQRNAFIEITDVVCSN
jgi:hypothetical protein